MVHHHSTALESSSEEQYRELHNSGILNALFQAQMAGCAKHHDRVDSRFDNRVISERSSGDDRWHYVDSELLYVADRFQMTTIWVQPTTNPRLKMLFLKHQNILLSAHQVRSHGACAPFAWHREPLKAVQPSLFASTTVPPEAAVRFGPVWLGPDQMLCTPRQLQDMVESSESPLSYWMYVYEQTSERLPRWAVLGRPVRGQKKLQYSYDVMKALGFVHPSDTQIELNPDPSTPPTPPFGLPKRERQGGEGED